MKFIVLPLPSPRDKDLLRFIIHCLKEQGVQREWINIDKRTNEVQIYGRSEDEITEGKDQVKFLIQDYFRYLHNKQHGKMNTTDGRTKVDIPWDKMGLVIGKQHCNIKRIAQETGAKIYVGKDEIYVGGDDEKRKKAILELKNIAAVKSTKGMTKVGIPERAMKSVIGKNHSNIKRFERETRAVIEVIDGAIYVDGDVDQCKKAIKKLKTYAEEYIYNFYIKKQLHLEMFDFVDGTGQECNYKLEQTTGCPKTYWRQDGDYYKIAKVDEDEYFQIANGEIDIEDLENTVAKVLKEIQKTTDGSSTYPKSDFWLHFGHFFITGNVDEDDQGQIYSLGEFQEQLNQKMGLRMFFDSAVENMEVKGLYEALQLAGNECIDIPPHTRYDIMFLTPSCVRIRVKIFLDTDNQPTKEFIHEFIDVRPDHSSSAPYLLCDRFYHRAKISIAIPSSSMDVRMMIRTVSTCLTKTQQELDEETEHEDILKTYLDRIEIQNGEIKLPDDLPDDFCMYYLRKCERRSYSYDKRKESFTIVISEEQEIDPWNDGKQFDVKTDVHINSDEINKLLRSGEWEPAQIIGRLPKFLSVVREIQANISASADC